MHILKSKHIKLKSEEVKKLLDKYNISLSQLPKIVLNDSGLPENCVVGDVVRIERQIDDKLVIYHRVVAE